MMLEKKSGEIFAAGTYDDFHYTAGKFYRTRLDESVRIDFAGNNFCAMMGYTRDEIHDRFDDRYIEMVYPDDREVYGRFIEKMKSRECSLMAQYRLVNKAGNIIHVSDTMTSKVSAEGMWGFSTVTDITDVKSNGETVHDMRDEVPCGIIRFTCERFPAVLAMNSGMESLLGAGSGGSDLLEDMKENIYMMLPFEYRKEFRSCLKKVDKSEENVSLRIEVFRCDGSRVPVAVWLRRVNTGIEDVYQAVFLDSGMYFTDARQSYRRDFLNAVTYVYDGVYELNTVENTVKCLRTADPDAMKAFQGVRMLAEDTVEYWSRKIYPPEEKGKFTGFFRELQKGSFDDKVPQTIEFAISERGDGQVGWTSGGGYCKCKILFRYIFQAQ